jgi:hypothetical protein
MVLAALVAWAYRWKVERRAAFETRLRTEWARRTAEAEQAAILASFYGPDVPWICGRRLRIVRDFEKLILGGYHEDWSLPRAFPAPAPTWDCAEDDVYRTVQRVRLDPLMRFGVRDVRVSPRLKFQHHSVASARPD